MYIKEDTFEIFEEPVDGSLETEQIKESFPERVLRDMSSAVIVLNRKGEIEYMNAPASAMLEIGEDYHKKKIMLLRFLDNAQGSYNDSFNEGIFAALYDKDITTVRKVPYKAPSGKKYIVRMSSSYLKDAESEDALLVITLNDETVADEMTRKFNDSSITFTVFLFGFSIWIIVYGLWEYLGQPISADSMTRGVEILGVLILIFILKFTSLTWRDLGITTKGTAKVIKTALIVSALVFVAMCALKEAIIMIDPDRFDASIPFFDFNHIEIREILYVFTAGIQEFLARSVMQENLERIIAGRYRSVLAILLSSCMFAALHIHLGFVFMIGAAVLGGLEGILYEKQHNIIGVWIVHWTVGFVAALLWLTSH